MRMRLSEEMRKTIFGLGIISSPCVKKSIEEATQLERAKAKLYAVAGVENGNKIIDKIWVAATFQLSPNIQYTIKRIEEEFDRICRGAAV